MLLLVLLGSPLLLLAAACLLEWRDGRRSWGRRPTAQGDPDAAIRAAKAATAVMAGVIMFELGDGGS